MSPISILKEEEELLLPIIDRGKGSINLPITSLLEKIIYYPILGRLSITLSLDRIGEKGIY